MAGCKNIESRPKLLYFVSEDWYFRSHRLPLAVTALESGYDVYFVGRVADCGDELTAKGIKVVPLDLRRSGKNPLRELAVIRKLIGIYRRVKPDIVHHVAMKPVIYGSMAAKLTNTPVVINALAGMGYLFTSRDMQASLLRYPVKVALRLLLSGERSRVIVQNPEDQSFLQSDLGVGKRHAALIRGSGVDLSRYAATTEPVGPIKVLLASRMLKDKGVCEFVEAARMLRRNGCQAEFVLAGDVDPANPASLTGEDIAGWQDEGIVTWLGWQDDMAVIMAKSHVVCLPSYREGLPKVLLEAAACARPMVATDVSGCREVVRHGENGLLIKARDSRSLADAIKCLIDDAELRAKMGSRARRIAEGEFSLDMVIDQTLALYRSLL